jgi:hypothetical protein
VSFRAWSMIVLFSVSAGIAVGAETPDGMSDAEVAEFLATLQQAVRADKPEAVAAMTAFPLRVDMAGRAMRIADAKAFVKSYRSLFTKPVRDAVLAQQASGLFRNAQGSMIGGGEVWFSGICEDVACGRSRVAIIAVNVPKAKR